MKAVFTPNTASRLLHEGGVYPPTQLVDCSMKAVFTPNTASRLLHEGGVYPQHS
ncbi:hypothetical protein DPMN_114325 [Dreissena polymorpha]|uniref:Uncharacterized protein n=1 Tax=Dreissena polymorpha TaxID=45954 RepID=A0A9D4QRW6_DREPO|nr:hypothetical protein DPMN_114325 [Dreissena polymorpha]